MQTPEKSGRRNCRSSTLSAQDFPASRFRALAAEPGLGMLEVLCSLKLPDWLKQSGQNIFYLRTFPTSLTTTGAGRIRESLARFQTWGMVSNGLCLTANILESPNQGGGCSLSAILIPDASGKYFLSSEQVQRLLYQSSEAGKATMCTQRRE